MPLLQLSVFVSTLLYYAARHEDVWTLEVTAQLVVDVLIVP
jgi:hypothetical protein